MRVFILYFLLLLCSNLTAQVDTLYYNKEYKGVSNIDSCYYWRVADRHEGTFVDYYKTGEQMLCGKFSILHPFDDLETRFEGVVLGYYKNGDLKETCNFKNGFLHGKYQTFYPGEILKEKGFYKNGEKDSLHVSYSKDGSVEELKYFVKGERCSPIAENYRLTMLLGGDFYDNQFGASCTIKGKQQKLFDKYLSKFEPTKAFLDSIGSVDGKAFWDALLLTNPDYRGFDLKNSKKKEEKLRSYKMEAFAASSYYEGFPELFYGAGDNMLYNDFLKFFQGSSSLKPIKKVCLVDDEVKNAFAFPDGTICITIPLFYELTTEEFIGVLAHEMAHYVLSHAFVSKFAEEKRKRKNRIAAGILAGINMAASAYVQANGGVSKDKSEEYWSNVENNNRGILYGFDKMTERFKYRYSRGQEMEADIVAYRFLQYMGYDPRNYSRALGKIIGFDIKNITKEGIEALMYDEYSTDSYSDHPSILERCLLLEYIEQYDKTIKANRKK